MKTDNRERKGRGSAGKIIKINQQSDPFNCLRRFLTKERFLKKMTNKIGKENIK